MDRNLSLNLVRVTEAAAIRSSYFLGKGDKNGADGAAVEAMRSMFNELPIEGTVVIGEGEMDEAPMLYIGEVVGNGQEDVTKVDIAVDPVDGTTLVANGLPNAIAVAACAPKGCLLHAPDMYMDKIAAGPLAVDCIHIDLPIEMNIRRLARALGKEVSEVTVSILNRERHQDIIDRVRKLGARIKLFEAGDIAQAIATCIENSGCDLMVGIGGAPEGVLAAAAIKALGGVFQGRLVPADEEEFKRCEAMGLEDPLKVLEMSDLVKGEEVLFAATGVTDGELLNGVRHIGNDRVKTYSVVMRAETGTIRNIEATHRISKKPEYTKIKR
ncbi:class II fructose-bisphosphatase [Parvimonas sp. KA00067]|uniref:class II fructose-bisphosphatase n=1 Tax=Parvimonas sp. KA00067 TaxID=1588755 RepID=UPI00083940DB|nr:class II fructose-bisphosphatase [Parvimonas sp. KA00067]